MVVLTDWMSERIGGVRGVAVRASLEQMVSTSTVAAVGPARKIGSAISSEAHRATRLEVTSEDSVDMFGLLSAATPCWNGIVACTVAFEA